MKQTYIEWLYPGLITSETSIEKVKDRTIPELKNHAFGFRFFDRTEMTTTEGEELIGKPQNHSGFYYEGEILTLEDVKLYHSDKHILIANMQCNEWDKVVLIKQGQFIPLREGDTVLTKINENSK